MFFRSPGESELLVFIEPWGRSSAEPRAMNQHALSHEIHLKYIEGRSGVRRGPLIDTGQAPSRSAQCIKSPNQIFNLPFGGMAPANRLFMPHKWTILPALTGESLPGALRLESIEDNWGCQGDWRMQLKIHNWFQEPRLKWRNTRTPQGSSVTADENAFGPKPSSM